MQYVSVVTCVLQVSQWSISVQNYSMARVIHTRPVGVAVTPPGLSSFTCRAVVIACTCDYPARAQVMNVVQYNAFYGCSHCLQEGKYH